MSQKKPSKEYVQARHVLLDALSALEPHLDAVTLVGAQAVYLHTGDAELAVAPTTTDADIALAPFRLKDEPLLEEALRGAGFVPADNPGSWRGNLGIAVDLMVPDALMAGTGGRRGARLPVHGNRVARRTAGLEPALVDSAVQELGSFESDDDRSFMINVAGPAALLVAKLIKVNERKDQPGRIQAKDGLDILRILQAIGTQRLSRDIASLIRDPLSRDVTEEAVAFVRADGVAENGILARLAVRAVGVLGNPDTIAGSMSVLVEDLIDDLDEQS